MMPYASNAVIFNVARKVRAYQRIPRSRALVPYRTRQVLSRYKSRIAGLSALTVGGAGALSTQFNGRYLNNMRLSTKRAFRVTRRMFRGPGRRWAVKQRQQIGERVGTDRTRSANAAEDLDDFSSRILYTTPLIQNIPEGTGNAQRMRDLLNVRGFKLRVEVENNQTLPLYVNFAVVHPKQKYEITLDDFFRDNGGDRSINFNDTSLDSLDYATRNINADRYNILMHKRFRLASDAGEIQNAFQPMPNTDATRILQFYVPFKRQIRYDDAGTGELPIHQVYFLCWVDTANTPAGNAPIATVMRFSSRFITYFRNTRD